MSRRHLLDSGLRDRLSGEDKQQILEANGNPKYWLEFIVLYLKQSPTDKEVVDTYGKESIKAYRLAEKTFANCHRGCGNPTIAHTQDTAYRLRLSIGQDQRYMQAALLHDVVEDKSKSFQDLERGLEYIVEEFGEDTARDVDMLTNTFSVLAKGIEKRTDLEHERNAMTVKRVIHDTLDRMEEETKEQGIYGKYQNYFNQFRQMIRETKAEEWTMLKQRFETFTLYDFLKFRSYDLYLEEIKRETIERAEKGDEYYAVPLLVKLSDSIDNIRTTSPLDRRRMDKLIVKTESRIKLTGEIVEELKSKGHENTELENRCKQLKAEYVHFLKQSINVSSALPDSRWQTLRTHIKKQYGHALKTYYQGKLPPIPEEDLSAGL
ncbi:HD domain-containing protein [Candidatus Woesearchaeota archaeon]|nr:HD domain-containing protein [Candidatus Woesearchaeota archaeon]